MSEFRAVKIACDLEAGLYWVNDPDPAYRQLVCEAKTLDALQRKLARLLDTDAGKIELLLPVRHRHQPL